MESKEHGHVNKARRKGLCIAKPIVIGTYATEAPAGSALPYEWTCVVRSGNDPNEDITHFVKSVTFQLHDSFTDPVQTVESPPYTVSEKGYGEFQIVVKINWVDTEEKSLEMVHYLQLKPDATQPPGQKVVVNEQYDEALFQDPHDWFVEKLRMKGKKLRKAQPMQQYFKSYPSDTAVYNQLCEAHAFVQGQIVLLQEQFIKADQEYRQARQKVRDQASTAQATSLFKN